MKKILLLALIAFSLSAKPIKTMEDIDYLIKDSKTRFPIHLNKEMVIQEVNLINEEIVYSIIFPNFTLEDLKYTGLIEILERSLQSKICYSQTLKEINALKLDIRYVYYSKTALTYYSQLINKDFCKRNLKSKK